MDEVGAIDHAAVACGVSLNGMQKDQVRAYLSLLEKWRRRVNLTSVTDPSELLRFHFLEACWLAEAFLTFTQTIADIGSGAGFPGMVIKLYQPGACVILIEKNYRKSVFLTELARELSLQAEVFPGLAENFPSWDRIDLAVIRALRPSSALLSLLAENNVLLLVLHGREEPDLASWELVKRERFPLSENRWATLYRAQLQS